MLLADTILVGEGEQDAVVLTASVPKGFGAVSYFIEVRVVFIKLLFVFA